MRYLVVLFIREHVPNGTVIKTQGLYAGIYSQFPKECQDLGFTDSAPIEPKWKNGIRWGLRDAKAQGLIKHVGLPRSGEWKRL
jgi:hypothetical protein